MKLVEITITVKVSNELSDTLLSDLSDSFIDKIDDLCNQFKKDNPNEGIEITCS